MKTWRTERLHRYLGTVAVLLLSVLVAGAQGAEREHGVLLLEPLIDEALASNPVLLTKENQVNALRERIAPAATLPDPMLRLGLLNLPEKVAFDEDPMTQKQIAVTQKFPFPGKLSLKHDIAQDEYLQHEAALTYQRLEVVNTVKVTYFSLFFVDKSIEVTATIKTLLEEFLGVARTRYSVGKGIQQDVMKAEIELSRMIEKIITLERQKKTVAAQLNTVLDRPPGAVLEGKPAVRQTDFSMEKAAFVDRELHAHPLLQSIYFIREEADDTFQLAQKEYYPDFEVGFSYSHRESSLGRDHPDLYSGFVGMNVPIWFKNKQGKRVEEARYNKQSAEKKYEATRNEIEFRIASLLAEIEQNSKLIDLYRDAIIPQANHTLNSSVDSYQVGSVDFLTLLSNLQTLYSYELEYYRVLVNYEKNLADLELAVGKRIF